MDKLKELKVRKSWVIGYLNKLRKKEIKWVIDELEYDLNDMNKKIADIEVKERIDNKTKEWSQIVNDRCSDLVSER